MRKVRDYMTKDVYSLKNTDTLNLVRPLMKAKRVRHIPIIDAQNHLMGVVTHRDILAIAINLITSGNEEDKQEKAKAVPIAEFMQTDIESIGPDDDIRVAAEILLEHKLGCLPVLENQKLIGILTEADFLKLTIKLLNAEQ